MLLGETGENILDVACCTAVLDIVDEEEDGPAWATDPEVMTVACDDDPALLVDTVAWLDEGNSDALKQNLIQQNDFHQPKEKDHTPYTRASARFARTAQWMTRRSRKRPSAANTASSTTTCTGFRGHRSIQRRLDEGC